MKYRARFEPLDIDTSEDFDNEVDAQNWLDERNNNIEHRTDIDIVDEQGHFIDGYIYTLG